VNAVFLHCTHCIHIQRIAPINRFNFGFMGCGGVQGHLTNLDGLKTILAGGEKMALTPEQRKKLYNPALWRAEAEARLEMAKFVRVCKRCETEQPIAQFRVSKATGEPGYVCRECERAKSRHAYQVYKKLLESRKAAS
jgi:hypothetical protein